MKLHYLDRNFLSFYLLEFIILGFCTAFSGFRAALYISIACLLANIVFCLVNSPEMFLKYIFVFFFIGTDCAAVIIDELTGIYLTELRCYAHFNGSFPLIALAFSVFLFCISVYDRLFQVEDKIKASKSSGNRWIVYFSYVVTILFIILFLDVADNPSFLLGVDRFKYAVLRGEPNRVISMISEFAWELIIFPLAAVIFEKNYVGLIGVGSYCLYCVWTGEKFGPFFTIMIIVCLMLFIKFADLKKETIRKILYPLLFTFGFIVVFAVFAASLTSKQSSTEYIFQRLAQQGQLWWRTYEVADGETHPSEFDAEIVNIANGKSAIKDNVGENYAMYKIMYLTAPKTVVDYKLKSGSRYSEAGYACAYYYFGVAGVLMYSIIYAILFAKVFNDFILAVNRRDIIKMFALFYIFISLRFSFAMFTTNELLNKYTLACIVYLILARNINATYFTKSS